MAEAERQAVIRKAYSKATTELRNNHATEFNGLVAKHAQEEGVEWKPRPTAKDRAQAKLDEILAEFPDLINNQ